MGIRQPVPPSVDLDLDGIPDDTLLRKGPGNTIISSLASGWLGGFLAFLNRDGQH